MASLSPDDKRPPLVLEPKPFIDLLKDTWPVFKDNWALAIGGPALFLYLPFIVVGIPIGIISFLVALVCAIVAKQLVWLAMVPLGIVGVALYAAAVNAIRPGWTLIVLNLLQGERATFADLKKGTRWFWNFFICMFIIGVATAIGGFLFVVPGLYVAVRTSFAPFLVIDEDLGPIEALQRSNELVTGYGWQILGCIAILWFTNMVAGFLHLIGLAVTPAAIGYYDLVLGQIYLWQKSNER